MIEKNILNSNAASNFDAYTAIYIQCKKDRPSITNSNVSRSLFRKAIVRICNF